MSLNRECYSAEGLSKTCILWTSCKILFSSGEVWMRQKHSIRDISALAWVRKTTSCSSGSVFSVARVTTGPCGQEALDFEAVLRNQAASCLLQFLYRPRNSIKRKPLRKNHPAYIYSLRRKKNQPDQNFCRRLKISLFRKGK